MDKREALIISKKYAEEVRKTIEPEAIYLYGSFANGMPHEYSDIDIAIIVDNLKENKKDISVKLWRIADNVNDIIEPILLDRKKDRASFINEVIETGIQI